MAVDVTKRAEVEGLVQKAIDTYGRIDVLVNNAGIMPIAPLALLKVDEWDRMIDINDVMRSLVLLLLLTFGLTPASEARSIHRSSRPRPESSQKKSKKVKRNRNPPIYDKNGRRKN